MVEFLTELMIDQRDLSGYQQKNSKDSIILWRFKSLKMFSFDNPRQCWLYQKLYDLTAKLFHTQLALIWDNSVKIKVFVGLGWKRNKYIGLNTDFSWIVEQTIAEIILSELKTKAIEIQKDEKTAKKTDQGFNMLLKGLMLSANSAAGI